MSEYRYVDEAWGLVPARGGSKSIPKKNLVPLAGRPLIDYVVRAGQESGVLSRIEGSTDDSGLFARMQELGISAHRRPPELSADDAPVTQAAVYFLNSVADAGAALPEIIVLLQPTSPFLLPEHVRSVVERLRADPEAGSCQSIIACPHNAHAVNQRLFEDGTVRFVFAAEREKAYNKQRKKHHFLFGNLVATRTKRLLAGESFFANPSVGVEIPRIYGFDLDDSNDLTVAEALLAQRVVAMPHLSKQK